MRGAEHVEFEAMSYGAMGEPLEPVLPDLLLRMNRDAGTTLRTGTAGPPAAGRFSG